MLTDPSHPEYCCQRCGSRNPSWHAPNELWNRVMGSPDGIICPVCFEILADTIGITVHCVSDRFGVVIDRKNEFTQLKKDMAEAEELLRETVSTFETAYKRSDLLQRIRDFRFHFKKENEPTNS